MTVHLRVGHVLDVLATLPAESVQTVVTSPPYWGLRAYGTEPQAWAITEAQRACEHEWTESAARVVVGNNSAIRGQAEAASRLTGGTRKAAADGNQRAVPAGATCARCDCFRGELGQEPTVDCLGWATGIPCGACYLCHLIAVFRAVRRVLRRDGTCWVNLGDCFSSGNSGQRVRDSSGGFRPGLDTMTQDNTRANPGRPPTEGLPPKNLVMVPHRFALAAQADGWHIRSDCVWNKGNPMPESVTDRPTRAHEYVFLLTRSARYFYDGVAIAEPASQPPGEPRLTGQHKADAGGFTTNGHGASTLGSNQGPPTRNARSVWTINTEAFECAHFATFPRELARRCILAGSSERGRCPACGAPWRRVVKALGPNKPNAHARHIAPLPGRTSAGAIQSGLAKAQMGSRWDRKALGWGPTCHCLAGDPIPCVVLDPFAGSGTTGLVAEALGRDSLLIELSPTYAEMAAERTAQRGLHSVGEPTAVAPAWATLPLAAGED